MMKGQFFFKKRVVSVKWYNLTIHAWQYKKEGLLCMGAVRGSLRQMGAGLAM